MNNLLEIKNIFKLGIGDGDWGLGPIPNPQIPNPQYPIPKIGKALI